MPRTSRSQSTPPDLALSPQSELPRGLRGEDRSGPRNLVSEMSWAQVDEAVRALAREVSVAFSPGVVVGVAPGGLYVGSVLASVLGVPFQPLRVPGRSRDPERTRAAAAPREVKGAQVLLVDDVVASGETLRRAAAAVRKAGARQVKTATLLCRDQGAAADWTVLVMEGPLVFPWDYQPVTEDGRFDLSPQPAPAARRARSRA